MPVHYHTTKFRHCTARITCNTVAISGRACASDHSATAVHRATNEEFDVDTCFISPSPSPPAFAAWWFSAAPSTPSVPPPPRSDSNCSHAPSACASARARISVVASAQCSAPHEPTVNEAAAATEGVLEEAVEEEEEDEAEAEEEDESTRHSSAAERPAPSTIQRR